MSKVSPTQRSLRYLKAKGFICQVVEKYISFTHQRIDLFHCIDILCIKKDVIGVLGIQTTTASNKSKHLDKIKAIPEIKIFLEAGNKLILHTWSKKGARGKRKVWTLKEYEIFLKDLTSSN